MDHTEIIQQALYCELCDTVIISQSVHDFQSCNCERQMLTVDGGKEYFRQTVYDDRPVENLCLTLENTFEEARDALLWGTRGKEGNDPLTYIKLKDCELDHLKNIVVLPHLVSGQTPGYGLYHAVLRALIAKAEGESFDLNVLVSHESLFVRELVTNSIERSKVGPREILSQKEVTQACLGLERENVKPPW